MSVMGWFRRLFGGGSGGAAVRPTPVGDAGIGAQPGFVALEDAAAVDNVADPTDAPSDTAE